MAYATVTIPAGMANSVIPFQRATRVPNPNQAVPTINAISIWLPFLLCGIVNTLSITTHH